jgi:hypothetical protein
MTGLESVVDALSGNNGRLGDCTDALTGSATPLDLLGLEGEVLATVGALSLAFCAAAHHTDSDTLSHRPDSPSC